MTNKTNNVKLLYKNSNYNKPYDIAILNIESNAIPDQFFATISKDKPIAGEVVYSIGFPFFKNLGTNSFKPCIFDGRVTKYQKGILFTDCSIQSGNILMNQISFVCIYKIKLFQGKVEDHCSILVMN